MLNQLSIRFSTDSDLPKLVEIYNQAIKHKKATADLTPFSLEQRKKWFNQFNKNNYPIYSIELDGKVIGYGSLSPYRNGREALQQVAEISFYLDYDYLGIGAGSALVKHIIDDCKRLNKKTLLAFLVDVNFASIKLLQKFNFQEWGKLPLYSNFDGNNYNHLIYGLNIENG